MSHTYLNQKTKKYYVAFYYTAADGSRKKKKKEGFRTKREAEAWRVKFLNEQVEDCSMLFITLFDNYMADYRKRHKPNSIITLEKNLRKHLIPTFGNMRLDSITPLVVRKWQNKILGDNTISPKYQYWLSRCLSTILKYAVTYYGLKSNPVPLAGPIGTSTSEKMSFWTLEQFNRFIGALQARENPSHSEPITPLFIAFNLLFHTGMRIGEMLALTFGDYDPQEHTLTISKSMGLPVNKPIVTSPKTSNSIRTIKLSPQLCNMLDSYMANIYDLKLSDFIFHPMVTRNKIRTTFNSITEAENLPKIRIHDLRHSHASLLIEMGASPLLISKRLGHKNIQITLNTYSHLYPNKEVEMVEKLDKIIKPWEK